MCLSHAPCPTCCFPDAALFEGGRWSSILRWTPREWAALLYQSVGVHGFAKYTQQLIIWHVGEFSILPCVQCLNLQHPPFREAGTS